MKLENTEQIKKSLATLEKLKEQRGGTILPFHKQIANDPKLLESFSQQFKICKEEIEHIPPKYVELILLALGCVKGVPVTINTHGNLAVKKGATIEEIGETLRLVFFYCGASSIIPAAELFEEISDNYEKNMEDK